MLSNKERKRQQRHNYHQTFDKLKHGHGGRWIRKKEQSALGSKGSVGGAK